MACQKPVPKLPGSLFDDYYEYKRLTKRSLDFLQKKGSKKKSIRGPANLKALEIWADAIRAKKTPIPDVVARDFRRTISLRARINQFFRTEGDGASISSNESHEYFTNTLIRIYNKICEAGPIKVNQRSLEQNSNKHKKGLPPTDMAERKSLTFETLCIDEGDTEEPSLLQDEATPDHKERADAADQDDGATIEGDPLAGLIESLKILMRLDQLCALVKASFAKAGRGEINLTVSTTVAAVAHFQSIVLCESLVKSTGIHTPKALGELVATFYNEPIIARLGSSFRPNVTYNDCAFSVGLCLPWLVMHEHPMLFSQSETSGLQKVTHSAEILKKRMTGRQRSTYCIGVCANNTQPVPSLEEDHALLTDILRSIRDPDLYDHVNIASEIAFGISRNPEFFGDDGKRTAWELNCAFGLRLLLEGLRSYEHCSVPSSDITDPESKGKNTFESGSATACDASETPQHDQNDTQDNQHTQKQQHQRPQSRRKPHSHEQPICVLSSEEIEQRSVDHVANATCPAACNSSFLLRSRRQALEFHSEFKSSIDSVLAHKTEIYRCCTRDLGYHLLWIHEQSDRLSQQDDRRLFVQQPSISGSHLSYIQGSVFSYGLKLINHRNYVGCLLHVYNVLVTFSAMEKIPLLEELSTMFLDAVFLGSKPAQNYESRLVRFLGGKIHYGAKSHGHVFGSNTTQGMTIEHVAKQHWDGHEAVEVNSHRFDANKFLLRHQLWRGHDNFNVGMDVWARLRNFKDFKSATRKEKAVIEAWVSKPTSADHPLEALEAALQKEYEGKFPMAKVNFFAVWEACANIFCEVGMDALNRDRCHADPYTCFCTTIEIVAMADTYKSRPHLLADILTVKLWKAAIESELKDKKLEDFLWKSL